MPGKDESEHRCSLSAVERAQINSSVENGCTLGLLFARKVREALVRCVNLGLLLIGVKLRGLFTFYRPASVNNSGSARASGLAFGE